MQPRLASPEHGIESHQEDPHARHDSDLGKFPACAQRLITGLERWVVLHRHKA